MHEGNFTQQIVDAILEELKKYPSSKARHVRVKVGEMLHLNSESVQTHFEILTKGTRLEGTKIRLEEAPVQVRCRKCHAIFHPEDHHAPLCEACSSTDVEVLSGQDVTIEAIDLEN